MLKEADVPEEERDTYQITVAKHRDGPTGMARFYWHPDTQQILPFAKGM